MKLASSMTERDRREVTRHVDRIAEPATAAALSMLDAAKVPYQRLNAGHYLVAEKFELWPAGRYWRAIAGAAQGHDVRGLINAVHAAENVS